MQNTSRACSLPRSHSAKTPVGSFAVSKEKKDDCLALQGKAQLRYNRIVLLKKNLTFLVLLRVEDASVKVDKLLPIETVFAATDVIFDVATSNSPRC